METTYQIPIENETDMVFENLTIQDQDNHLSQPLMKDDGNSISS